MSRPKKWSKFAALQQKQMDATLRQAASIAPVETPSGGWIKSIRQALGMTAAQLGKRLRTTPQSVLALEKRESRALSRCNARESRARARLPRARAVHPESRDRGSRLSASHDRARDERNRIVHTMGLEAQGTGVREALISRRSPSRGEPSDARACGMKTSRESSGRRAVQRGRNTPLDEDEIEGLIPPHVRTRARTERLGSDEHQRRCRVGVRTCARRILSVKTLRELHRRMFGATWAWAGTYRRATRASLRTTGPKCPP